MRSVNLIPPDERRGDRAPLRTGNLSYVLVAGLAVFLLAIVAVALTSKQISDRESEKASLEQELADATARAESLRAFADFRAMQESRAATVSSLAQSRFDWERVLQELARVIPSDTWLIGVTGTVNPNIQVENGADVSLRDEIAGPALEIEGCTTSQDSVAAFVSSLEDIDGVTRVGVESSLLGEADSSSSGGSSGGSSGSGVSDCQTKPDIAKFKIVIAFDAVPAPPTATSAPSVPPALPPSGSEDGAQVADAQTQQATQAASVNTQTTKAQNAVGNLIPGN